MKLPIETEIKNIACSLSSSLIVKDREALFLQYGEKHLIERIDQMNQKVGWNGDSSSLSCQALIEDKDTLLYMADSEKHGLFGYAIVVIKPLVLSSAPFLEYLAVMEKTKGIGTAILVTVCNDLLKKGHSFLSLKCNVKVLLFYQKFGERVNTPIEYTETEDKMYFLTLNLKHYKPI